MEELNIHFQQITIKQLIDCSIPQYDDPYNILQSFTKSMQKAFIKKPTKYDENEVCQIIALDENKVIGCEMGFTSRLLLDGEVIECQSATTLFSHPDYRKYGIGSDLMLMMSKLHQTKNNFAAGASQMAQPLYKALRYSVFSFPRFIFLKKSRCAINYVLKTDNVITKLLSAFVDLFLSLHRKLLFSFTSKSTNKYIIEKVKETPDEVERIVIEDEHRFKELHDKAWFDWCLNNKFLENSNCKKEMFVVKNESGSIVAFFVNKIEFFAEASSRFKNIWLGTVIEWGIKKGYSLTEAQLQILAIRNMPSDIDGVQVASSDKKTIRKFKKCLFFPMGEANNLALIRSVKPDGIKDINNWRIRIAGGDTLIE